MRGPMKSTPKSTPKSTSKSTSRNTPAAPASFAISALAPKFTLGLSRELSRGFARGCSLALALAIALPAALISVPVADARQSEPEAAASDSAPKGPPPTPVRVAMPVREVHAARKKVFGELRPSQRTTVAAEEPGIVREVAVRVGDRVRAGDKLAMLDGARLQLEQSALDADIALAQTTIAEREAERGRAERDLDLLRRASAAGGTNPRELADAESALAIATARKTQALAAIEVLNEAKKLLAKRVSDLTITAPFEGVVTARHVDLGAWAAMGGSIVDIADTVHLEAWFDVPQELYEFVHSSLADRANASGASTTASSVTLQSVFGRTLTPTSIRIVPEIDPKARTFHAIAAIDNTDGALAAGLAVEAFIPQGNPREVTIVPKDALVYSGRSAIVYVVQDGIANAFGVDVLFPLGDRVAVLGPSALKQEDALVVIEGNERLMQGTPVVPIAPVPAAEEARP